MLSVSHLLGQVGRDSELTPTILRGLLTGRPSPFHGFGSVLMAGSYSNNRVVEIPNSDQLEENFSCEHELFVSNFPNFNWDGLHRLPTSFLVRHGSMPAGSVILPTNIPLEFPKSLSPKTSLRLGLGGMK